MEQCCKDCESRVLGCHGKCVTYKKAKKKHDEQHEKEKKDNENDAVISSIQYYGLKNKKGGN